MSRAVFLRCKTCDVDTNDSDLSWEINHGEKLFQQIWERRGLILALYQGTDDFQREQVFGYGAIGWRVYWIAAHADHEVVWRDEYGEEGALTLPKSADRR